MKYMLLIYSDEKVWSKEEWTACTIKSTEVCHELAAKGQFHSASPLHPVETAQTVRVRDNTPLITAGPFAETTEQLGGYFLIDVPNLDQAIAIAARLPGAAKGTVEIRPVAEVQGLPADRTQDAKRFNHKFMFLCYDDAEHWRAAGEVVYKAALDEAIELTHELDSRQQYLLASPLQPVELATSVRVRDEKRLITDGPFAETSEVLGGFYLIQADTLNDAVAIAAKHSGARVGSVEVRQVFELSDVPAANLSNASSDIISSAEVARQLVD